MSARAVAWQERLMTGRTLNPGPSPLGSGVGITMFLLIFCAKCHLYCCVHWGRCCVGNNPPWSGTAEKMESVCGYLWEKRVPVEATFSGAWVQGDPRIVALCLLPSWCLLPASARSWVFVSPPGPTCGCQSTLGKGPGNPTPPGMCVLGEQSLPEPLPADKWGRTDVSGNCLCCRCRSWLCTDGLLWPAVYRWLYRSTPGFLCWGQWSFPVTNFHPCVMQPARKIPCPLQNKEWHKQTVRTDCGIYKLLSRCLCYIYIWSRFNHT